jgi:outer membrane protein TolC
MTETHRRVCLALCAWMLVAGVEAGGQTPVAPAAPPAAAREQAFAPTLPYEERITRDRRVQRMTSREAVELALRNNLDMAIERYNEQLARQRLNAARGYYDPSVSLTASRSSAASPLTGSSGGTAIPSDQIDVTAYSPGVKQNIPGGGSASVSLLSTRTGTSSTVPTLNPVVSSSLGASLTQPLLRGFLVTAADRQIDLARIDAELAASQYRQRLTGMVQQVLAQYWELAYAISVYETRRQSKDLAIVQYEGTKMRVQSGLLPPIALTAARAEIASRERDILQAEVQIIGAENALKLLISQDPASPVWERVVLPTDRPAPDSGAITFEEALALATTRRPELEQLRLQMAQNAIDRTFYRRETLPTVNLTASLTSAGRSGTALVKLGDARIADPTNPSFGGFQRSWRQVFGFDFPAWALGLTVQVPLGNRAARAQLEQVNLIRNRLDTQKTKTLQSVMVDVRYTVQVIATQRKSLEAATLTTQLFAEQLEGQTARYAAGFSNDFELRRYQRDLVDARVKELRALVDLQLAVIALQRATDTLLDTYGVAAAKRP